MKSLRILDINKMDLEYIAQKMDEYSGQNIEMTSKRVRSITGYFRNLKDLVEINTGMRYGNDRFHFGTEDLEVVGQMDFILQHFYPEGDLPEQLVEYQNFVNRIKGIDSYHSTLEAKLQRDYRMLRKKDSVSEWDIFIHGCDLRARIS